MKKISVIFGLFLFMAMALISCGSDDDDKKEYSFSGDVKQVINITGNEKHTITTPEITVSLEEALSSNANYGWPIASATMDLTEGTSIKITGFKEGVVLQKCTLWINGHQKIFNEITADKANLYTSENLSYFTQAFNSMISARSLKTKFTFTPSTSIEADDNMKLEITFRGRYTYWR